MGNFEQIWQLQEQYNLEVFLKSGDIGPDWMLTYITGLSSEVGELLRELNWKKHRNLKVEGYGGNVAEELADITKYVISMWQLAGFSSEEFLTAIHQKTLMMHQRFRQEHEETPVNEQILMLDLDGVVADFRRGFLEFAEKKGKLRDLNREAKIHADLHMDVQLGWNHSLYNEQKNLFESGGGYATLPPMMDRIFDIWRLQERGIKIVVWTARPVAVHKRIWYDTWSWLENYRIKPDVLNFGSEGRISHAWKLQEAGNRVMAIEDNPVLIQRYAASGIPVWVADADYNRFLFEGVAHPLIRSWAPDEMFNLEVENVPAGQGIGGAVSGGVGIS